MNKKKLVALAAFLLATVSSAFGQASTYLKLSDLKDQGAQQLTVEELRQLLPGAKVRSLTPTGSSRHWDNSAEGKFIATSDGRGSTGKPGRARGQWHIGDNGAYCVLLEWSNSTEQWCRFIFKAGERYYGVSSTSNSAVNAYEFVFDR